MTEDEYQSTYLEGYCHAARDYNANSVIIRNVCAFIGGLLIGIGLTMLGVLLNK
jgi:hypothetical protein